MNTAEYIDKVLYWFHPASLDKELKNQIWNVYNAACKEQQSRSNMAVTPLMDKELVRILGGAEVDESRWPKLPLDEMEKIAPSQFNKRDFALGALSLCLFKDSSKSAKAWPIYCKQHNHAGFDLEPAW